mmetsp:Transcript_10144/g.29147  ORF Transcript_10144/g.29147 Transcript_10144/m.29147 type:complete len:306 (+) Transcript_10144:443-1360(+)
MPWSEPGGNTMVSPAQTGKRSLLQKASPEPERIKKTSYADVCVCGGVRWSGWKTSTPNVKGRDSSPSGSKTSASRLLWLGSWNVSTSSRWRRLSPPGDCCSRLRPRSRKVSSTSLPPGGPFLPVALLVLPLSRLRMAASCAPASSFWAMPLPRTPRGVPACHCSVTPLTVQPGLRLVALALSMSTGNTTLRRTNPHPPVPSVPGRASSLTGPCGCRLVPTMLSPGTKVCREPSLLAHSRRPTPQVTKWRWYAASSNSGELPGTGQSSGLLPFWSISTSSRAMPKGTLCSWGSTSGTTLRPPARQA